MMYISVQYCNHITHIRCKCVAMMNMCNESKNIIKY